MSPKRSSESVETIVNNPDAAEDESEEIAEVALEGGVDNERLSPRASDYYDLSRLDNVSSVEDARKAAHIPPHFPMKELEGKTIIIVHKREQKAALPETGELRNGYFCLCVFADDRSEFTTWIGQTILFRELTMLALPFKTTVTKRGRTYMFA